MTNDNLCSNTSNGILLEIYPQPTVNISGNNILCYGESTTLIANSSNAIKFKWNTGDTTASVTVKPSATTNYNVTITDNHYCTGSGEITVVVNPLPIVEAGKDTVIAFGDSLTLTGTASGGTSPYTYSWAPVTELNNPNIPDPIASPKFPVTYTLHITDKNGCKATDSVKVNIKGLWVNTGNDTSICQGAKVSLTATTQGGNPPYSYIWTPSNGLNNANILNPIANPTITTTYTIKVTDKTGASVTDDVIITVYELPVFTLQPLSQTACNGNNVSFSIEAQGKEPIYFQWQKNGNNITGATNTIFQLNNVTTANATTYNCNITNECGSSSSDEATLSVISEPVVINPSQNFTFLVGQSDTMIVQASGTAPFTIQWKKNGTVISNASTENYTINNLQTNNSGTYTCNLSNICGNASATFVINVDSINIIPGGTNNICNGDSIKLQAAVSNGLTYQWTINGYNIKGATKSFYYAKSEGTYNTLLTNNYGTEISPPVYINLIPLPVAKITSNITPVICQGDFISLSTTSGNGYIYQWLNDNINIQGATDSIYNAADNGFYTVKIINSYNCSAKSLPFIVTVNTIPPEPVTKGDTICSGSSAILHASGSTGIYEWWDSETGGNMLEQDSIFTTPVLTSTTTYYVNSINGNRQLKITECYLVQDSGNFVEIQNLSLDTINSKGWIVLISDNLFDDINAYNSIQWELPDKIYPRQVLYRSHDPTDIAHYWGDYIYWQGGSLDNKGWAMIIDNNYDIVDFAVWAWKSADISNMNLDFNGHSIKVGYEWNGDGISSECVYSLQRQGDFDSNTADDFECVPLTKATENKVLTYPFMNEPSCISGRVPVMAVVLPKPTADAGVGGNINAGQSITLNGKASGKPPLKYNWQPASSVVNPNSLITIAKPDYTTIYNLQVTDGNNCTASSTVLVTVGNISPVSLKVKAAPDTVICKGESVTLSVNATGGTKPYTFEWTQADETDSIISVSPATTTTYKVFATDKNGNTATAQISITVITPPKITNVIPGLTKCSGQSVLFNVNATGYGLLSYQWEKDNVNIINATANNYQLSTISYSDTGSYSCNVSNTYGTLLQIKGRLKLIV